MALARAKDAADAVALLMEKARSVFDDAREAATATCERLQPFVVQACSAKRTADAMFASGTASGTSSDGEGGLQVQSRPDGTRIVLFGVTEDGRRTVGNFPASASENVVIQISGEGDSDKVVCQFVSEKGDVAIMSQKGDALQILMSEGGVLACKLLDDNVIQVSPKTPESKSASSENIEAAISNYLSGPHDLFHVACRFNSSEPEELKGCTFSVPDNKQAGTGQSLGLLHHAETSELAQSHWSEDRIVCIFRDGLVCERSPTGQVVIM